MEMLATLVPEIVQSTSTWVEDRYGRAAGWAAFFGMLVAAPLLVVLFAVGFAVLSGH
jgi:uncharacterized BrkB/YihY/UPF0761 family membrane protein